MPKMPTKENLSAPGSLRTGRQYISASEVDFSAVGAGMKAAGRGIASAGASLDATDEKKKNERDALELIQAEAKQRQSLFETERQFDNDGDYATQDQRYTPLAINATKEAASGISDPRKREMWLARAHTDVLQGRERIIKRSDAFAKQDNVVKLDTTLDGLKSTYTDANTSDENRVRIASQIKDSIELAKRAGIVNPAHAAKLEEQYLKGSVMAEAERRVMDDPEGLRRELLGKDVPLVDDQTNPELRAKPIGSDAGPTGPVSMVDYARGKGRAQAPRATGQMPNKQALLEAQIEVESGGKADAVSESGAIGLLQVKPDTARDIAKKLGDTVVLDMSDAELKEHLKDKKVSRRYGGAYMDQLTERYNGDTEAALLAYKGGPSVADKWLKAGRDDKVLSKVDAEYAKKVLSKAGYSGQDAATPVAAGREEGGRFVADGLNIVDRIDPNAEYGRGATERKQQFTGIVMHHTSDNHGGEQAVKYGQSVDPERGGAFGYHFYIDRDGTILQGAPMDRRTNHVKDPTSDRRKDRTGISNENAIGISLVGKGGDETPQQLAAAKQLALSLRETYGIDPGRIVGHGDLQNDRESTEGQAALKAIRGEIRTDEYGAPGAKGRYAMLTPLERADLLSKTERSMRTRMEGQREQLKQSLDDDVESIRKTGQPGTVDLDTAKRVLEPNQVNRYFLQRQEAELEYKTLNDLPTLSNAQLQSRLDEVAPPAGAPLFEMRQKIFDKAAKQVEELRELRTVDPARSVETLPEVRQAATAVNANPEDPEAVQNLAKARIDAQRRVGVPDTRWSPITKAEARQLMAPVKGLEGKALTEAMMGVTSKIETMYGPYARAAGIAAIEHIVHNKELAEELERKLTRATKGLPETAAAARRIEFFNESAQASRAFGPGLDEGVGASRYGPAGASGAKASFANPDMDDPEVSGSAETRSPFQNFTGPRPTEEHIKALIGNPATASDFNRRYGAGQAEIILATPIEQLFPPAASR